MFSSAMISRVVVPSTAEKQSWGNFCRKYLFRTVEKWHCETEQGADRGGRCNRALKCRRSGPAGWCLGTDGAVWTRYILITCCRSMAGLLWFVCKDRITNYIFLPLFKPVSQSIKNDVIICLIFLFWDVFSHLCSKNLVVYILFKRSDTLASRNVFSVFFSLSYGTYSHSLGTWHLCPRGCGWYGERCETGSVPSMDLTWIFFF